MKAAVIVVLLVALSLGGCAQRSRTLPHKMLNAASAVPTAEPSVSEAKPVAEMGLPWGEPRVNPRTVAASLIPEARGAYLPTRYVEEALHALGAIVFTDFPEGVLAAHEDNRNEIWVTRDMMDPRTRLLKSLRDLEPDQIATLYHEFWHVYLDRVARPRHDAIMDQWNAGVQRLYPRHLPASRIHDEAYGVFISEVIGRYIMVRRGMEQLTPEKRERARRTNAYPSYREAFQQKVFGYYGNQFTGFVESDVNLPQEDRENILVRLFDKVISPDFAQAFAENKF